MPTSTNNTSVLPTAAPSPPLNAAAEKISDPRYQWFEKTATAYLRCRVADITRALDRDEIRRDLLQFFDTALFSNMFVLHDSTVSPTVVTISLGAPPSQEVLASSASASSLTSTLSEMQKNNNHRHHHQKSSSASTLSLSMMNNNGKNNNNVAASPSGSGGDASSLSLSLHHGVLNRKRYLLFSRLGKERLTPESLNTRVNIIELSSDLLGSASWMLRSVVFPLLSATPVHGTSSRASLIGFSNQPNNNTNIPTSPTNSGSFSNNNKNSSFSLQHQHQQQNMNNDENSTYPQLIANGCKRTVGGTFVASDAALHALTTSVRNIANALVPLASSLSGTVVLSHTILQRRTPQLLSPDEVEVRDCLVGPDFAHMREVESIAKTWIDQVEQAMNDTPNYVIDDLYGPDGFFAGQRAEQLQQNTSSNNNQQNLTDDLNAHSSNNTQNQTQNNNFYNSQSDVVCPIRRPLNEVQRRRYRLHVLEQILAETSAPIVKSARQALRRRKSPLFVPLESAISKLATEVELCRDDLRFLQPLIPAFRDLDVLSAGSGSNAAFTLVQQYELQEEKKQQKKKQLLLLQQQQTNNDSQDFIDEDDDDDDNNDEAMNNTQNTNTNQEIKKSRTSSSSRKKDKRSSSKNKQKSRSRSSSNNKKDNSDANKKNTKNSTNFFESLAAGLPQKKCFVALGVFFAKNDHMANQEVVGGLVRGAIEGILLKVLSHCSIEYLFNDNATDLIERIALGLDVLKATKDALALLVEVSVRYRPKSVLIQQQQQQHQNKSAFATFPPSSPSSVLLPEKPWMLPPSLLFDRLDRLTERLLEVSKLCSKKSSQTSDLLSALPGPADAFRKAVIAAEERRAASIAEFSREGLAQLGFLSTRSFDRLLVSLNETLTTSDMSIADACLKFATNAPLDTDTLDTLTLMAPVFTSPNLHQLWFKVLDAVSRQWLCFARFLEDVYRDTRNGVSRLQLGAEVLSFNQQQQLNHQNFASTQIFTNPTSGPAPVSQTATNKSSNSSHNNNNSPRNITIAPAQAIADLAKKLAAALTHAAKLQEKILVLFRSTPVDIETVLNIDLKSERRGTHLIQLKNEQMKQEKSIRKLLRSQQQNQGNNSLSVSSSSSSSSSPSDSGDENEDGHEEENFDSIEDDNLTMKQILKIVKRREALEQQFFANINSNNNNTLNHTSSSSRQVSSSASKKISPTSSPISPHNKVPTNNNNNNIPNFVNALGNSNSLAGTMLPSAQTSSSINNLAGLLSRSQINNIIHGPNDYRKNPRFAGACSQLRKLRDEAKNFNYFAPAVPMTNNNNNNTNNNAQFGASSTNPSVPSFSTTSSGNLANPLDDTNKFYVESLATFLFSCEHYLLLLQEDHAAWSAIGRNFRIAAVLAKCFRSVVVLGWKYSIIQSREVKEGFVVRDLYQLQGHDLQSDNTKEFFHDDDDEAQDQNDARQAHYEKNNHKSPSPPRCWIPGISDDEVSCAKFIGPMYRLVHATNRHLLNGLFIPPIPISHHVPDALDEIANTQARLGALKGLLARYSQLSTSLDDACRSLLKYELRIVADLIASTGTNLVWRQTREIDIFFARLDVALQTVASVATFLTHSPSALEETFRRLSSVGRFQIFPLAVQEPRAITAGDVATADLLGVVHSTPPFFIELAQFREMCDDSIACTRGALAECARRFAQLISDKSLDALNEIKIRNGLPPIPGSSRAWSAVVERSARRVQVAYDRFACQCIHAMTSQLLTGCLGGRQHLFDLQVSNIDIDGAKRRRRLSSWLVAAWDAVTTGGTPNKDWMKTCRGILAALDVYFKDGVGISNNNNNNNQGQQNLNQTMLNQPSKNNNFQLIEVDGVIYDEDELEEESDEDDDARKSQGAFDDNANDDDDKNNSAPPQKQQQRESILDDEDRAVLNALYRSLDEERETYEGHEENNDQHETASSKSNTTATSLAKKNETRNINNKQNEIMKKPTSKLSLLVSPAVSIEISAVFLRSAILYNYGFAREFSYASRKKGQEEKENRNNNKVVPEASPSSSSMSSAIASSDQEDNDEENNATNLFFQDDDDDDQEEEEEQNNSNNPFLSQSVKKSNLHRNKQLREESDPDFIPKNSDGMQPKSFAVRCRNARTISLEAQELHIQLEDAQGNVDTVIETLLGPMHRLWSCVNADQVLREEVGGDLLKAAEIAKENYQKFILQQDSEHHQQHHPQIGSNATSNNNNNKQTNDASTLSNEKKQQIIESYLEVQCLGTTFSAIHNKLQLYQRASQSIVEDVPDMVLVQDWFRIDFRRIRSRMKELASTVEARLCQHTFEQLALSLTDVEKLIQMLDRNIVENKEKAMEVGIAFNNNDDNNNDDDDDHDSDDQQENSTTLSGSSSFIHKKIANDGALLTIVDSLRQIEIHRQSVPQKFPILASVVNLLLQHTTGGLRADCLHTEVRLSDLPQDWDNAIRRALSTRDALSGRIQSEQKRLSTEADRVNEAVRSWQTNVFLKSSPATCGVSFSECYDETNDCQIVPSVFESVYEDLDRQYVLLQGHYEHLLEVRNLQKTYEGVQTPLDVVSAARSDIIEAKQLWDFIAHAVTEIHSWFAQPLRADKTATLTDKARFLRESLYAKRPKNMRDWPIFRQVDERLRFLYASFPAVNDITAANLKDRHWDDLRQSCLTPEQIKNRSLIAKEKMLKLQRNRSPILKNRNLNAFFITNKVKTVGEIVSFNLPAHAPDMGRILEQAEKESQIEKTLSEICTYWDNAVVPVLVPPFSLNTVRMRSEALSILLARGNANNNNNNNSPPSTKSTTSEQHDHAHNNNNNNNSSLINFDCALLLGADDMVEVAQEHISRIQSMVSSRWAVVFMKTLEKYQSVISEAETALTAWADVQRQWLSLRPIYASGSDLLQQLPEHAQHFKTAESQFIEMILTIVVSNEKRPRVIDVCNLKFEMNMMRLGDDFQHCEHGLARFLANKRQRFSRFYFLSDSDLIDLLAGAHDPKRACRTHIGRIIEAVHTVKGITKLFELVVEPNFSSSFSQNNTNYYNINNAQHTQSQLVTLPQQNQQQSTTFACSVNFADSRPRSTSFIMSSTSRPPPTPVMAATARGSRSGLLSNNSFSVDQQQKPRTFLVPYHPSSSNSNNSGGLFLPVSNNSNNNNPNNKMKQYHGPFDDSSDPDEASSDSSSSASSSSQSSASSSNTVNGNDSPRRREQATHIANRGNRNAGKRKTNRNIKKIFAVQILKSRENETLHLVSPILLDSSVDVWLDQILAESQRSVLYSTLRACSSFADQRSSRTSWMFSNITQATTVAMRTVWTRDVTAALDAIDRGNATAMSEAARQHQSGLTELIEIVSDGSLTALKRKAIITWITISVHQRDVLSELQESLEGADAGSSTHYIWQRELRFYVQQKPQQQQQSNNNTNNSIDLAGNPLPKSSGFSKSFRKNQINNNSNSNNVNKSGILRQQSSASSSSLQQQSPQQHQLGSTGSFVNQAFLDSDIMCRISNVTFRYTGEYHGACGCLVFTPLTSRCYLTLAQSLSMFMGGAPSGPAGTGKTETTKDMARAIGLACYVFNCSPQMTHNVLANIFSGLAASGVWGCFDEFNRISIEVLSVVATQVRTVFEAVRARAPVFSLGAADIPIDGETGKPIYLPLKREVGIFITMNPGYKGRTELPANVKALFRPCAMVVPDVQQICEILLSAEGFVSAKSLAIKFARCYTYAKQQLSSQMQYDWGLRAMRAVLLVAGNAKRAVISRMMADMMRSESSSSSSSSASSDLSASDDNNDASKNNRTRRNKQKSSHSKKKNRKSKNDNNDHKNNNENQQHEIILTLSQDQEALIFARALYTSNLAKLHLSDIALLKRLILALFPEVSAESLLQMGDQDDATQDLILRVQLEAKLRLISLQGGGGGSNGNDNPVSTSLSNEEKQNNSKQDPSASSRSKNNNSSSQQQQQQQQQDSSNKDNSNNIINQGAFMRKISQLIDALKVRHSIFIMGPPVSGKTTLWRLLACAYNGVGLKPWIEVIEPKSLTSDELYGFVHPQSHEWHDGILSKTFRNFAHGNAIHATKSTTEGDAAETNKNQNNGHDAEHEEVDAENENKNSHTHLGVTFTNKNNNNDPASETNNKINSSQLLHHQQQQQQQQAHDAPKWIVLDGVIDPHWVETMNSVMDDNKLLTLPNNERIAMTSSMRLVFEIGHLQNATPATVSRAGIVVMNDGDISWSCVKDRFIGLTADPAHRVLLDALMEKHMSMILLFAQENLPRDTFAWQSKSSSTSSSGGPATASSSDGSGRASTGAFIPSSKAIEWTKAICSLFQGIVQQDEFRNCHPLPIEIIEPLFIWCAGNILGSTIPYVTQAAHIGTNYDQRFNFNAAFRRQFPVLKYSAVDNILGSGGIFGSSSSGGGNSSSSTNATIFDVRPVISRFKNVPEGSAPVGTIIMPWIPPALPVPSSSANNNNNNYASPQSSNKTPQPPAAANNRFKSAVNAMKRHPSVVQNPTLNISASSSAGAGSPTISHHQSTMGSPSIPTMNFATAASMAMQQHKEQQLSEFLCFRFIRWDASAQNAFVFSSANNNNNNNNNNYNSSIAAAVADDNETSTIDNNNNNKIVDGMNDPSSLQLLLMNRFMMHPTTPWCYQIVPTQDAIRMKYFTQVLLSQPDVNVLLVGPASSAKTLFARNFCFKTCGKMKTRWVDGDYAVQREDLFSKACQVHPDYSNSLNGSNINKEKLSSSSRYNHNHNHIRSPHQRKSATRLHPSQYFKSATTQTYWFSSWSFTSTRQQVQRDLETKLERRGPHTLGPLSGSASTANTNNTNASEKKENNEAIASPSKNTENSKQPQQTLLAAGTGRQHLILVIDDLNLPEVDEFQSSSALSFLRQLVSLKSVYDKERLISKSVQDVRVLATLDPSREGCGIIDDRLLARFIPFALGVPHEEQSKFILYCFMTAHCTASRMKQDLVADLPRVASLLVDVLVYLCGSFAPTESYPQHRFTLRDITRAAESLCRALRPRTASSTSLPAATIYHTTRAVADRLGTSGYMQHLTLFVREAVLNRFADNSGAADLLELAGGEGGNSSSVFFVPPPATSSSASNNNNQNTNNGENAASKQTTLVAEVNNNNNNNNNEDPDQSKKVLLGSFAPLLCSSVENANNLPVPMQQQEYFQNKAVLMDISSVSTIMSIGNDDDNLHNGNNNNHHHNQKTSNMGKSKIHNSSSTTGNGAMDRLMASYSDWSYSEYHRVDSLQILQRFLEEGLSFSCKTDDKNNNINNNQQYESEGNHDDDKSPNGNSGGGGGVPPILSNFVFFDAALVQIAACARILSAPGGHMLLLGLGGSGRRYVLRLASMYLGYELIVADVSSISEDFKDTQEWKSQISLWQRRAVLKDIKMCVAVTGCENTTPGGNIVLSEIHEILRNAVCFSSFTAEERDEVLTTIQSSKGTLPSHLQSPFIDAALMPTPFDAESLVWDSFTVRSRQNLHIAVVMSLIPTKIRQLRRRFPAFTDETQLLHSHPWSRTALFNVCQNIFEKNELTMMTTSISDNNSNNNISHNKDQLAASFVASKSVKFTDETNQKQIGVDDECFGATVQEDDEEGTATGGAARSTPHENNIKNASSSLNLLQNKRNASFSSSSRNLKPQTPTTSTASSPLLTPQLLKNICDFLSQAHGLVVKLASTPNQTSSSSSSASAENSDQSSSRILVTPKHFLLCVNMFIKLLKQKSKDVSGQIKRLSDGLHCIDECEEQVESLKKRLTVEGEAVRQKAAETSELLRNVEEEKIVVSEQHTLAELEEARSRKLVDEVTALVNECNNELQLALPAVHAARDALRTLDKQNLSELKAMGKPPSDVHAVTACVLCLMTPPGERIPKDRTWQAAKTKLMGDVGKWLRELQEYDVNNIPEQNVNAVRPTIADPTFNRAVIERKSYAAAGLCEWVINIVKYHDLHQLFVPKEIRLDEARHHQQESQEKLERVRRKLQEYKTKLDGVIARYENAKSEQQRLQDTMKRTEAQLDRARRLVSSLGGERRRWMASRDQLERNARRVAPEMCLAAVFFVYSGAFNFIQRKQLWDELVHLGSLAASNNQNHHHNINTSIPLFKSANDVAHDAPVSTLFNEADLAAWSGCGLPSDTFSRQSAAIVRINEGPFAPIVLIDPQHRASNWIGETLRSLAESKSKNNNDNDTTNHNAGTDNPLLLQVLQPDSPKLATSLMNAIHTGKHVMVAGVSRMSRTLLAVLEGLAACGSSTSTSSASSASSAPNSNKNNRDPIVSIPGYSEVALNSNFRLYIQFLDNNNTSASSDSSSNGSNSNGVISAECFTLATVVDFSATEDGFVEQLLDRALQLDRPELQIELTRLLQTMNRMTVSLREREDNLLEQLSSAGGSILDDESLVASLERTRAEAKFMQQTLTASEEKKKLTTEATRRYLPVALRATTVFLRLQGMRVVDPIYSFSIDPVLEEFDRGIRWAQSELQQNLINRNKLLNIHDQDQVEGNEGENSNIFVEESSTTHDQNNNNNSPSTVHDVPEIIVDSTATAVASNDQSPNIHKNNSTNPQQSSQNNVLPSSSSLLNNSANNVSGNLANTNNLLKNATPAEIQSRVELMTEKVTECIFLYGARAVFSQHKLAFASAVCFSILLQDRYPHLTAGHLEALLRFPRRMDCTTVPAAASWLSLAQWQSLDGLSRVRVPNVVITSKREDDTEITTPTKSSSTTTTTTIATTNADNTASENKNAASAKPKNDSVAMTMNLAATSSSAFKYPFSGILDEIASNARWRTWVAHPAPEAERPPGAFRNISDVEQLLLVRCLRSDRFATALRGFVADHLGSFAVTEEQQIDFPGILRRHSPVTPLLFVVSPGADASSLIDEVAARAGYSERSGTLTHISLGQGQETKALNSLQKAFKERSWVVLHNVHLLPSWSFKLERELARLEQQAKLMQSTKATDNNNNSNEVDFAQNNNNNALPTITAVLSRGEEEEKRAHDEATQAIFEQEQQKLHEQQEFALQQYGDQSSSGFNTTNTVNFASSTFINHANPFHSNHDVTNMSQLHRATSMMSGESNVSTTQFAHPLAYAQKFPGGPQTLTVLCEADVKLLSLTENIASEGKSALSGFKTSAKNNNNNNTPKDQKKSQQQQQQDGITKRRPSLLLSIPDGIKKFDEENDNNNTDDQEQQLIFSYLKAAIKNVADPDLRTFRVFLTAEPRDQPLLGNLVTRCIKIVCEPPQGVAANFLRAYSIFEDEPWEGSPRPNEMHGIVFSLCFFHSLVTERIKFGAIGWNKKYPFSIEDLKCAVEIAISASEGGSHGNSTGSNVMMMSSGGGGTGRIQWAHLRFFISRIIYGGHIVDPFDLRLCSTYLDLLLSPELLESGEIVPGIPMPGRRTHLDMMTLLSENFPEEEDPAMFHMHAASASRKGTVESQRLVQVLSTVAANASSLVPTATTSNRSNDQQSQPTDQHQNATNKSITSNTASPSNAAVATSSASPPTQHLLPDDTIGLLIGSVPEPLPVSVVHERFDMEGVDNVSPLQLLMLRESERMNRLTGVLRNTLESLDLAERGGRFLTEQDQDVLFHLRRDVIPESWAALWGPTVRPLAAWLVLVSEAHAYLNNWCNEINIPKIICVRYLFSPSALFSALQQDAAAKLGVSLETVDLALDILKVAGHASSNANNNKDGNNNLNNNSNNQNQNQQQTMMSAMRSAEIAAARIREGCVIVGLTLDGAAWDQHSNCLTEAPSSILESLNLGLMPPIAIRGAVSSNSGSNNINARESIGASSKNNSNNNNNNQNNNNNSNSSSAIPSDRPNTYWCPLYRTWRRGESWIITLPLRTREPQSKWVLRSVALIADDHGNQ